MKTKFNYLCARYSLYYTCNVWLSYEWIRLRALIHHSVVAYCVWVLDWSCHRERFLVSLWFHQFLIYWLLKQRFFISQLPSAWSWVVGTSWLVILDPLTFLYLRECFQNVFTFKRIAPNPF